MVAANPFEDDAGRLRRDVKSVRLQDYVLHKAPTLVPEPTWRDAS